jgi:hypothetical protein
MPNRPSTRTGVLVLSVWREEDATLRARITHTPDVLSETRTSVAAGGGVDDICSIVRAWLDSFARGDDSVTGTNLR